MNKPSYVYLFFAFCLVLPITLLIMDASAVPETPVKPMLVAANQGDRVAAPGREDLRAMLRICEALRDHVKGLIAANLKSWERGYAE